MLGRPARLLLQLSRPPFAAEESAEEVEELEEVQVTGTRIQSPNVTSANPINSITGEEMRQLGIVNVRRCADAAGAAEHLHLHAHDDRR